MTSQQHFDVHATMAIVNTLTGLELRQVCRQQSLPISGVKATVQARIRDRVYYHIYIPD
jgi:hypothetical protein